VAIVREESEQTPIAGRRRFAAAAGRLEEAGGTACPGTSRPEACGCARFVPRQGSVESQKQASYVSAKVRPERSKTRQRPGDLPFHPTGTANAGTAQHIIQQQVTQTTATRNTWPSGRWALFPLS